MKKRFNILFVLFLALSACSPQPKTLTVMTHSSFAVSEDVVKSFEDTTGIKVTFVQSGDAGEMLNKAILTKDAPLADVMFGVDNTFLSRALGAGIYETYQSPSFADVPDEYKLDSTNQALPVDFGDVCLNYDKKYFEEKGLSIPASLEDLSKLEYKNMLVMENPATSSTGLAFLLATRAHFGEDGYLAYWKSLKDNGVTIVDGWETAYYTNFSGSSGHGSQPLVVSYATSPAAEVVFANPPVETSPTGSITASGTCFRQIEFAGILKGTHNRAAAEKFIDFMLSTKFQEDMPLQMFVYPVNKNATLPDVFLKELQTPSTPALITPDEIAANRDAWIEAWTKEMK